MFRYEERSYKIFGLLSFLLFPLVTLVLCIKDYRQSFAKNLFWFFCAFLGMIHIFNPQGGSNDDGSRTAQGLIELQGKIFTWNDFLSVFQNLNAGSLDFYEPIISVTVSLFTFNAHWLFAAFALVFGFFYSRNIWFLLSNLKTGGSFYLVIFIIYYCLICPIWFINGVRMWTGLHVFMFGALPFMFFNNKKLLPWSFIALVVHFSYIIPLLLMLFFSKLPKRIPFLVLIYCLTFAISELNLDAVNQTMAKITPSFLNEKIDSYVNEDYKSNLTDLKTDESAYLNIFRNITKFSTPFFVLIVFFKTSRFWKFNKIWYNSFSYSILFLSFGNIASHIPSGARYLTIANFIFYAFLILYLNFYQNNIGIKKILLCSLVLIPSIFLQIRIGIDYYGLALIFENPITCWFFESNVPLIQYIKTIL